MQNNTAVSKHETLVNRLTNMAHLNSGYCLDPAQLAKGYETHLRITRRDFAPFEDCNIPLQKEVKCYLLDPKYSGQLSFKIYADFPKSQAFVMYILDCMFLLRVSY